MATIAHLAGLCAVARWSITLTTAVDVERIPSGLAVAFALLLAVLIPTAIQFLLRLTRLDPHYLDGRPRL